MKSADDSKGFARVADSDRTVRVLTKENEALRTVLARLHRDNMRLEELLLEARSQLQVLATRNETKR
jgi:hypothetical protein